MAKHVLKFYPVANGDTTLLKLVDKTTILIDCKIRDGEKDTNGNEIFDVKKDLLTEIQKSKSTPFLDVFVLTHGDQDHCQGFEKHFYSGKPENYAKSNRDNDEILINELWVTSSIFGEHSNDDAKAVKKEAERRRRLYLNDDASKDDDGNRLRMIGYDGDKKFEKVPNNVPGDTITLKDINGNSDENFEFFVHGPFKQSLINANAEKDRNSSSIILQARFKDHKSDDWSSFFLTGGDADHYRWKEVLNKSKKNGNEDKLDWDIFQTPHHCSWTYFNDVPYSNEGNDKPKQSSLDILEYGRSGAFIVASSKKIVDNDDNPPHYPARKEYVKKVDSDKFLNTNINVSEKKPQPIVFETSSSGFKRTDKGEAVADAALRGATAGLIKKPWCNTDD